MALLDRIKFDGPSDVLVWRWPSEAIRLGAQLVVNESQEALFFKGGKALDLFGPGTHTLASGNLPLLNKLINLPFGGKTPFAAEVYYINKTVALAQDWGTSTPIMLLDPKYKIAVPLRGYGEYGVRVSNSREFVVEVVGAAGGAAASTTAVSLMQAPILSCVQQVLGEFMVRKKVTALELPAHTLAVASAVLESLTSHYQTLGLELVNFSIESINFDPNDESVTRLRKALDEAARLGVVGEAFRQNQDFYRAERQFDVLEGAAGSGGAAGNMMGAAMGVGMGFGLAGPAAGVASESMAGSRQTDSPCPSCKAPNPVGARFCSSCGGSLAPAVPAASTCPHCDASNPPGGRFCSSCGKPLEPPPCTNCGAELAPGAKFCGECGTQA